jgi:hypothetical protein
MRQGQTHDLMARMTKVVTLPVVLFYEKGVDPRHPEEVVSWFQRFPGPVSVTVKKKPVELELRDGVLPREAKLETRLSFLF